MLSAPFITGTNKPLPSGLCHIPLLNFSLELIEGTLLFEDFYLPIIALIACSSVRAYAKHFFPNMSQGISAVHLCHKCSQFFS